MARVELPESRLKARKRRRRVRIGLVLTVFFLLLFATVAGLSRIPAIQIKSVLVSGAGSVSSSTIAGFANARLDGAYALVFPKRNIFLYPKREIGEALLAAYPSLSSVDVHANDFQSIAVLVVERAPRALWCASPTANDCYFMDEGGVVYESAPTFSEPIYLRYVGETQGKALPRQFLTPPEFQALSALVDAVAQKLESERVEYVGVDTERDVRIVFSSGFVLIFGLNDPGGDVFERLTLALTAEPLTTHPLSDFEYLDLRFGDKLYYKLK